MSLEKFMYHREPNLNGYADVPLRTDVSDLPERLGKAIAETQESIIQERGIEQQEIEEVIDFGSLSAPAPRPQPIPVPTPATNSLAQLSQQLKQQAPELSGYRTPTPTASIAEPPTPTAPAADLPADAPLPEPQVVETRPDGWNGERNGIPIGRDDPFAPVEQQPLKPDVIPTLDEQQPQGTGVYGDFLPSNPELKTQERGTDLSEPSYEPLSTEEGWNNKDFKAFMSSQHVYEGSGIEYLEPGTPYPATDGETYMGIKTPLVTAKDGFHQPGSWDPFKTPDDPEFRRAYRIGQSVIGHPEFGAYKAYWDGDKFVTLENFYRRWESGEFDFKVRKRGSGIMRDLKRFYESVVPEPAREYLEKGLQNYAENEAAVSQEIKDNLPENIAKVLEEAEAQADETGTDAFLDTVARNTQLDRGFIEMVITLALTATGAVGGSRRFKKWGKTVERSYANALQKAKTGDTIPFSSGTGIDKNYFRNSKDPFERFASTQGGTMSPENVVKNFPKTQPPAPPATPKRNTKLDNLVSQQSAKMRKEFEQFSQKQSAQQAARNAAYPEHIRKAFKATYGLEIPKGYKIPETMLKQLEFKATTLRK